ncbi:MAG TPA: hypothetical protein VFJ53_08810 [Solirubrobacterales bacterium]|nr:hypothetical protein [Solirubrobacterales bacterium]
MVVMTPRQAWTDERLDHFEKRVEERFDHVDEAIKELRGAVKDLHDDNMATNRVMMQGFIAIAGAIVAGCTAIAGVAAF